MFNINNSLTCAVFINGQEFPLDSGNALNSVHIGASTLYKLPQMQIIISDVTNVMPKFGLQDNVPLTITLNGLYKMDRNFRILNWSPRPIGDGFQYVINCYWDAPRYWAGSSKVGFTGTSSNVLAALADTTGLKVYEKNAKTSDSMTWMQANRSFSQFARDIARHGYVNDKSHMMLAVDSLGNLRYVDLNALTVKPVNVALTPPPDGVDQLLITDFRPITKSGLNNIIGGYQTERMIQKIDPAAATTAKQIDLKSDAQFPLVNTKVRSTIERGPISYTPISFGNVHDNYERALYQNIRFNLLKNLTGEFLFPFQTPFEPGSQIVFSQVPDRKSTEYNGVYTVTEKIIFIQGTSYNEKIIGVKNGLSN